MKHKRETSKKGKTTEEDADAYVAEICDMLRNIGINGIIQIDGYGSVSIFDNKYARYSVLEHAKIELEADKLLNKTKASQWLLNREARHIALIKEQAEADGKHSYKGYIN